VSFFSFRIIRTVLVRTEYIKENLTYMHARCSHVTYRLVTLVYTNNAFHFQWWQYVCIQRCHKQKIRGERLIEPSRIARGGGVASRRLYAVNV